MKYYAKEALNSKQIQKLKQSNSDEYYFCIVKNEIYCILPSLKYIYCKIISFRFMK